MIALTLLMRILHQILAFTVSDVDGDTVTTSILDCASNDNHSASINGNTINFVSDMDFNGSGCYTLVADDGTTTTSVDINITVNPVNDSSCN